VKQQQKNFRRYKVFIVPTTNKRKTIKKTKQKESIERKEAKTFFLHFMTVSFYQLFFGTLSIAFRLSNEKYFHSVSLRTLSAASGVLEKLFCQKMSKVNFFPLLLLFPFISCGSLPYQKYYKNNDYRRVGSKYEKVVHMYI